MDRKKFIYPGARKLVCESFDDIIQLVVPRGKFRGHIVEAASEIFRRPFLYNFN